MERLAATHGLEAHTHQLRTADLDRELVRRWKETAKQRAVGFDLGFWDGPFPEPELPAIAALFEVMNTQPLGSLALEHQRITPRQLREMEAAMAAQGSGRWVAYVRDTSSGRFAGFTHVSWSAGAPHVLQQTSTGVFP
jgi:hypothetical protein